MKEYKDIVAQLKYPGISKCMSEVYHSTNMDYVEYSAENKYDGSHTNNADQKDISR